MTRRRLKLKDSSKAPVVETAQFDRPPTSLDNRYIVFRPIWTVLNTDPAWLSAAYTFRSLAGNSNNMFEMAQSVLIAGLQAAITWAFMGIDKMQAF